MGRCLGGEWNDQMSNLPFWSKILMEPLVSLLSRCLQVLIAGCGDKRGGGGGKWRGCFLPLVFPWLREIIRLPKCCNNFPGLNFQITEGKVRKKESKKKAELGGKGLFVVDLAELVIGKVSWQGGPFVWGRSWGCRYRPPYAIQKETMSFFIFLPRHTPIPHRTGTRLHPECGRKKSKDEQKKQSQAATNSALSSICRG